MKRVTAPCVLGNKLLNIQFAKYHIWNSKSEGLPDMVLSTETFNQSVRTEYSEAQCERASHVSTLMGFWSIPVFLRKVYFRLIDRSQRFLSSMTITQSLGLFGPHNARLLCHAVVQRHQPEVKCLTNNSAC